ncbi:DUF6384 family protein [Pseudomonas aegrilactucae]|uniref:Uncharacterized protein n=1 Tax=Pseudomonas aegrilactucae TaxID=2854028 RepID=A0A9Q3AEB0_9PSED|nr:DUF6384 family protein [Pseudomonas aegrilactucae]MBV6287240.1 hypothetical protein [Pseudomonas aegrilactucae]
MSTVPLSEQLGAMAVVDQLRHQQMQVQEHLNLPQRRAEVASRIRSYYQSHGIAYDDALIEQGVRDFFARRLSFEAPPQSSVARLTSTLLLNRKKGVRILQVVAIALIAVQCTRVVSDTAKTSTVQDNVRGYGYSAQRASTALDEQQSRLATLQESVAAFPEPAASRLLNNAAGLLAQARELLAHPPFPQLIDSDNRDSVQQAVDTYDKHRKSADVVLGHGQQALTDAEGVLDARKRLRTVMQDPAYSEGVKRYPVLAQQAEVADQAINTADTKGIALAKREVTELEYQLERIQQVQPLIRQLAEMDQRIRAMRLPPADLRVVNAQSAQISSALQKLDVSQAERNLSSLDSMLDFAEQPLELRVVDRSGVKSGVERCYDDALCGQGGDSAQGKSWYLVVEAVDAAGNAISAPVTSSETGESRWASYFGVRVSQAEYLKIKEDKLSDGHIDDRDMGSKPANTLSLQFNKRVAKPDMILNW